MFAPVFNLNMFDENTGRIGKVVLTKKGVPKEMKREMDAVGSLGLVICIGTAHMVL